MTSLESFEHMLENMPQELIHQTFGQFDESNFTAPEDQAQEPENYQDVQITFRRMDPKVGRNDQCPCGSGKKYKKCCGQ